MFSSNYEYPRNLNATVGASFIGTTMGAMIYGITTVQTLLYFRRYGNDSVASRMLILMLWILDTVHLIFIVHTVYSYAVLALANIDILEHPLWCITSHVLISSISDLCVRGLFCVRIWKLSQKSWWMMISVCTPSLLAFASGWGFSIWGFNADNYFFKPLQLSQFLCINFASSLSADALIALYSCILLSRQRTGSNTWTDSIIRLLMLYSVNTGVLTSLCALLCLVLYVVLPETFKFAFVAIYFVLPKLLLNSLLASLNARKSIHGKMKFTSAMYPKYEDGNPQECKSDGAVQIQVETITEVVIEGEDDLVSSPVKGNCVPAYFPEWRI